MILAVLNNAVPFWLLAFAETRLDSGLTAVVQSAAPIFTVVLASRIDVSQRVTGARLVGVGLGFLGVALLVGVQGGGNRVAAFAVLGVRSATQCRSCTPESRCGECRRSRSPSVSSRARP